MRVLALDIGLKRTGVALSDELGVTTRALDTRTPQNRDADVAFVVDLVREHDVGTVVIGLPQLASGASTSAVAHRARGFAEVLPVALVAAGLTCGVALVDEAKSSQEASARLTERKVKKGKRKAALDGESARVLIERYWTMGAS